MLALPPPHNQDAEDSVVGAMLTSPKACERLLSELEGDEFYYEKNRVIFQACKALQATGVNVDPVLVADWLDGQQEETSGESLLDQAGGKEHLKHLVYITVSTGNSSHYADIVKEQSRQRKLAKLLSKAQEVLLLEGASSEETHHRLQAALQRYEETVVDEHVKIWPALRLAAALEDRLANPIDESSGIPVPFPFLPAFKPSRLYVLGGYQGDGKTSLAVQFAMAATPSTQVGFVSMEMSADDLANRIVATHGVPYRDAESGHVDMAKYKQRWVRALEYLSTAPLDVIDDPVATPETIDKYQRTGKYGLLIIDHLHRMAWDERRQLEQHVVAITNIARRHKVPVLLLAQLHRGQSEKFVRPTMKSFRESGMIEAEASACYLVYRVRDEEQLPTAETELIVAKNRYGPTLSEKLTFDGELTKFMEEL